MFMRRQYVYSTDDVGGAAPAEADSATVEPTEDGGATEAQIDWEKRAADNQAWATKVAQEASDLRQQLDSYKTDPEALATLLAEHGYELPEEAPVEYDDPTEALKAELRQEFQAQLAQRDQQFQAAAFEQQVEKHVETSLAALGDLSEADKDTIVRLAVTLPDENHMPNVQAAFDALKQRDEQARQAWAASKTTTHSFSPNGRAGEPKLPDGATHDQRVDFMLEKLGPQ